VSTHSSYTGIKLGENNSIFLDSIVNLRKINKILTIFKFIAWTWPASTAIVYNNPVTTTTEE
jgi:alpha-galactosidase/6-phospho-beta-glucosidase family protein